MAPQDKKWDDAAQRDLCLAIIQSSQKDDKFRINWAPILDIMHNLGYSFTKDAVSQHFTKVMMKDFKTRSSNPSGEETPKATPRKRTPKNAGGKAGKKRARESDEPVDESDGLDGDCPAKKAKQEEVELALF